MFESLKNNYTYKNIVYFFPIQLVLVHVKKNISVLIFWVLLFGLITQNTAVKYGIPYLFLDPEYLNEVGFKSFFLVGFACGGFIMAFNIASYIRNSFRFPFLATLSNPFTKYCLNNCLIPLSFIFTYIYMIIYFQSKNEYASFYSNFVDVLGFLLGNAVFLFATLAYFAKTNKDIFKMFGVGIDDNSFLKEVHLNSKNKERRITKVVFKKEERDWHVETYLSRINRIRIARGFDHYDKKMLRAVYQQNHKNAALFQTLVIISVVFLGLVRDHKYFTIPAGTSVFLLFTAVLMISSALYSFLRGWTTVAFIVILATLNYSSKFEFFHVPNKLIGLKYKVAPVTYNNYTINKLSSDTATYRNDFNNTLQLLENWKQKLIAENNGNEDYKPKIIFINTSGGGLRSSMWVTKALLHLDSITNGKFLKHTILMTGSSGGSIGAAFVREIILHRKNKKHNQYYVNQISQDALDPVALSIATNDVFLRLKQVEYHGEYYTKDRGISLEEKISSNCFDWFNKPLIDYQADEFNARIPMQIFSPTIMNDGRRLLISAQGISYLTKKNPLFKNNANLLEAIEYRKLFAKQGADSIRFAGVLRMSASFPYISPMANLPSNPVMEVMDAGVRDNYGITTTIQFIHCFRNWLSENTSGILILQLRDRKKEFAIEENPLNSITQTLTSPIGSFYDNIFHIQDYNFDQFIKYTNSWYAGNVELMNIQLKNTKEERISLSWHLTEREKHKVNSSIYEYDNVQSFNRVKRLLEE